MRLVSFDSIQKKLDKKNAELAKVRSLRKKLADREKIISADIDTLLEALRSSQPSSVDTSSVAEVDNQTNISLADSDKKTELDFGENLNSISKIPDTSEEHK